MSIEAQQFVLPSQIDRNRVHINPAFTGCYGTAVGNLMHKTVWLGAGMNYSYRNFEFHNPLKKQSIALGVQAGHEQIGGANNSEIFFNYGHRIRIRKARLAFGLKGGVHSKSFGNIRLQDETVDPSFGQSSLMPNFGFGMSYYSKDYFFGLSVPYVFSAQYGTDGNSSIKLDFNSMNYIMTAGGEFPVNSYIDIKAVGALLYTATRKPSYSIVVNANYNGKIEVGAGYRASEAIIVNAGYYISRQISLMYSYDITIGSMGPYSKGSHEIGLMIYWGFHVNTVTPRDF